MNRRQFLIVSTFVAASHGLKGIRTAFAADDDFAAIFKAIQQDPVAAQEASGYRDFAMADNGAACIPVTLNNETTCITSAARQPPRISPSSLKISDDSKAFIVFYEVTGKSNYNAKLVTPIWPGGDSGVTIGIGYDLGYASPTDFRNEWGSYLHPFLIKRLLPACGKKSDAAQAELIELQNVRIEWDAAYREFTEMLLPIFVAQTSTFCENLDQVPEDCRGALTSLIFNRGTALQLKNDPIDSRREMREIKDLMAKRAFGEIPQKFLDMQRLWVGKPKAVGVVNRRKGEAALFARGLKA